MSLHLQVVMASQISKIEKKEKLRRELKVVCREDLLALEGCEVVFALRWDLENCLLRYIFGIHLMFYVGSIHHA